VQSSWFPLYDRTRRHCAEHFLQAGGLLKATQRIYHASGKASYN